MNTDKDQENQRNTTSGQPFNEGKEHHPSPFKEASTEEEATNDNPKEEANLEQERKEAMTERD